jgi:AcrR family transcriptional regulator
MSESAASTDEVGAAVASSTTASAAHDAVVVAALELFARQGFEATSVDQIAKAAGVSRSTFFRQFGGKDDVVFADHDILLAILRDYLARPHPDPWMAVCDASVRVFRHFAADPQLARNRYAVVRQVPALRDREIVAVFRYERLFDEYLREALPGLDPLIAVSFAAEVTAIHNHVLRRLIRGSKRVPVSVLRAALNDALVRFGVSGDADAADDDVVVAVFPRRMPAAEVARRLGERLPR